jgi:DNA polymerase-3 subunit alpha
MPDFDVDFDERRRGEVIRYVTEKYGEDRVAQIVTYGTIKAKQAVKDSARVHGPPLRARRPLTKAMPADGHGQGHPLHGIFDPQSPMPGMPRPRTSARSTTRPAGAAGRRHRARAWRASSGSGACTRPGSSCPASRCSTSSRSCAATDGQIITQFDYPSCEKLGLVKMDFLGLRNLTILDDASPTSSQPRRDDRPRRTCPLDDKRTYELLARGDTLGVFQLDGGGMRTLLRSMQPDNFEDISAARALPPGADGRQRHTNYALRKNGKQPSPRSTPSSPSRSRRSSDRPTA